MLSLHDQNRGPWILLHVALDKGRFNMTERGRYNMGGIKTKKPSHATVPLRTFDHVQLMYSTCYFQEDYISTVQKNFLEVYNLYSQLLKIIKGTVPRDFRLLVFFMNQFPQAPELPLRPLRIRDVYPGS